MIPRYPNGATQSDEVGLFQFILEGEPAELKHLSKRRKRKQIVIPEVVASEPGIAQTTAVTAVVGL